MDKIRGFIKEYRAAVLAVVAVLALVSWWKYEFPSATWRYKMTVTVETPEGFKTGSAVREAYVDIPLLEIQGLYDRRIYIKGEAVVIDMGKQGLLFAPMITDDYIPVFRAFPDAPDAFTHKGLEYYQNLVKTKARGEVPQYAYPQIVRFKDINDPSTVELVYGEEFDTASQKNIHTDNFEKFFGKGFKLKNITIEMTDEQIEWIIDKSLPWLEKLQKNHARLNGSTGIAIFTNNLSDNLGSGSFRRER